MERQLFDWIDCSAVDYDTYTFWNITLKQTIKGHPIGTKFHSALLSFETGELHLINENGDNVVEVELELFVK